MILGNLFASLVSNWRGGSTGRGCNLSRARLVIEPLDDRLLPSVLSVLNAGQNMYVGDTLQSPNGLIHLYLDGNGDLIERAFPSADQIWDAHTSGTLAAYVRLQLDGNLVFHDGLGNVVGISNTPNYPGDVLRVQDDGNVVLYQYGVPLWSTNTAGADANLYLTPGNSAFSPNGNFQLTLYTNGWLNEVGPTGDLLWFTPAKGPAIEAILQTDGNFVLYGPNNSDGSANPVWASNTFGDFNTLWVQDDGNIVIYQQFGHPLWSTHTAGADAALYLTPGQSLYWGPFQLTLQTDGNFVLYGPLGVYYATGTNGQPVIEAILQTDGNLVLYGPNHADGSANPIWASNTAGNYGATYTFDIEGLLIYDSSGNVIWANGEPAF
jgi:hypothetical protein